MRGKCFDLIRDGMTVKTYIASCAAKLKINAAQARGCLIKMDEAPPKQKFRLVTVK